MPPTPQLPDSLTDKLTNFRAEVWKLKLIEGILAGIVGLALSFLLVFILDRLIETPNSVRLLILILGTAVPALGLPFLWHKWVWKQRKLEDIARLIRQKMPRLGDQLLGTVELARGTSTAAISQSPRLIEAAIDQAASTVEDKDLSPAIPAPRRHRRWIYGAAALLILLLVATILAPPAAKNTLVRWLTPWSDTPRYTFAQVNDLPETLAIPYAEPHDLSTSLNENSRWNPEKASLKIPGQTTLSAANQDASFDFTIPPQKEDSTLALRVGDDREKIHIQARTRPELSTLTAELTLPDYLGYAAPLSTEVRGSQIRLLDTAKVSWKATASRPLTEASINDAPQPLDPDGNLLSTPAPVATSDLSFTWSDQFGLTPREPLALSLEAIPDAPPAISARRESKEQVVLDTEVVTFDLSAKDDFGIQEAGLQWTPKSTTEETPSASKIAAAGANELTSLQAIATFSARRDGVAPGVVEIRAWATDYLPDREPTLSNPFLLRVLDPTDHALWLTDQFERWLDAARETYEREQQLRQTNGELRELSPEELDRPENRRKLAQQAAEEDANADRLSALNNAGKELAKQAAKNPEFEAGRLETWAETLEALEKIAKERMPSVAELLQKSSSAKASEPSEQASTSEPKPSEPSESSPSSPSQPSDQEPSPSEAKPSEVASADPKLTEPDLGTPPSPSDPSQPSDEEASPGKAKPSEPGPPPLPKLSQKESGFLDKPEPTDSPGGPPSAGRIGLPDVKLGALPTDEEPPPSEAGESPAQNQLDSAITEQDDLLAEFAKVTDELSELLANLETSTFVKRLKAASRAQMDIAKGLDTKTLASFGIAEEPAEAAPALAQNAIDESETLHILQSDLNAYAARKANPIFTSLLRAMKDSNVIREVSEVEPTILANLSGQAISTTEYWGDTLDRWAEDLVAAAPP